MTLIRKGIEQIRREGIENAQAKIKQQEEYQAKVDSMSKHNVGGLYDVRAILKSSKKYVSSEISNISFVLKS